MVNDWTIRDATQWYKILYSKADKDVTDRYPARTVPAAWMQSSGRSSAKYAMQMLTSKTRYEYVISPKSIRPEISGVPFFSSTIIFPSFRSEWITCCGSRSDTARMLLSNISNTIFSKDFFFSSETTSRYLASFNQRRFFKSQTSFLAMSDGCEKF